MDQLLQFTASGPVQCVNVTIVDDEDGETTEDFRARLLPDGPLPAGVTLTPDEAAVSIFDNEGDINDSCIVTPQNIRSSIISRINAKWLYTDMCCCYIIQFCL